MRAFVVLCAVLVSCDVRLGPEQGPTLVRFVNVAPDAVGPLQFALTGGPSAVLQHGESSDYVTAEPGTYAVRIEDDAAVWSLTGNLRIVQGLFQTVYAFGHGSSQPSEEGAILVGDEPTPPAEGRSLLRILHLAAAVSGSVDVHMLAVGEAIDPLAPAFSGLVFPSQQDYFFVSAGTLRVVLTATGTSDIIIDSGPLAFTSRAWYTAVLLNDDAGEPELIRLRDGG